MRPYLDLLQHVYNHGEYTENRTGVNTFTIPSAMLQFDLSKGFPAMTTKKLAWNQVKGELIGFLRGCTSAADFRALGCTIWDQNANENKAWLANPARTGHDDLGPIYGAQWRDYIGITGSCVANIDQIANVLHTLRTDPTNRRMLVTAWNPAELEQMALPPCHVLFKLMANPKTKTLHLSYYQRSCDLFLGVPFNIASYALLLELFAHWCGYYPGTLTAHMDDVHIYENHSEQVEEQLLRLPYPEPTLQLHLPKYSADTPLKQLIADLHPDAFELIDYKHHDPIKAPMAV